MFRKLHDLDPITLTIFVDGIAVVAEPGESIAAVLLRQPGAWARVTPVTETRRGPYCMMGVCFDCLAEVDGIGSVQTCLTPVRDGMRVVRSLGKRNIE